MTSLKNQYEGFVPGKTLEIPEAIKVKYKRETFFNFIKYHSRLIINVTLR